MKITIHRGINQIGGCITEVATDNTRIFIDLGHNLPDNEGISEDKFASKEAIGKLVAGVDAIFYTHYHGDHIELFHFVPAGIDQYIGETAKRVVSRKYKQLSYIPGKKAEYLACLVVVDQMKSLKAGVPVPIKEITITPYFVSHSAYESHMFLIEAEGKRILHTGDFRDHGYLGKGLMKILRQTLRTGGIDVLIIEGTMMSRLEERVKTERELQEEALMVMSKYKNVFVLCSSTDMERLATFYATNKRIYNRPFICDKFQKDILEIFSTSAAGVENRLFSFDKVYDFKTNNAKLLALMSDQGFCMLVRPTEKFNDYYDFLKDRLRDEDTVLIYSMWGMYIEPDSKHRKENYLDFVNRFPKIEKIHTSGHASPECIAEVCRLVNPSQGIIPIHGECAEDLFVLDIPDSLKDKITISSIVEILTDRK